MIEMIAFGNMLQKRGVVVRRVVILRGSLEEFLFPLLEMMYVLRGSLSLVCLCLFCLVCLVIYSSYNLSHKIVDINTLFILFGYFVLVWICETKLCFIFYFPHIR